MATKKKGTRKTRATDLARLQTQFNETAARMQDTHVNTVVREQVRDLAEQLDVIAARCTLLWHEVEKSMAFREALEASRRDAGPNDTFNDSFSWCASGSLHETASRCRDLSEDLRKTATLEGL
jgi:phage tail tape-measure protein